MQFQNVSKDLIQIHNTTYYTVNLANNFQKMNSIEKQTNGWGDFYLLISSLRKQCLQSVLFSLKKNFLGRSHYMALAGLEPSM